tara:strand:+ start:1115 stop:2464 length:1350 start_codon:yes stop_codon:yes gene_type:complete
MHKKIFSFLTVLFLAVCFFSTSANADLGNMLKQLENMGKKLDNIGEKKIPSPNQSGSSLKSQLTNRSLLLNWYLIREGKKDYPLRNSSQYVYFGKNGKMWGLFHGKDKKLQQKFLYAVSGKWKENNGRVCISHVPMYATSDKSKLHVREARKYCYNFPKEGLSALNLEKRAFNGFRRGSKRIQSFIIPKKQPDRYKKYNLVSQVSVSVKKDMTFRRDYKKWNRYVTSILARQKRQKKANLKAKKYRDKEAQEKAEQKAMQKARAKQEMSQMSSFKNARGKWGVKFGMTKRQAGAASKMCKYTPSKDPKYDGWIRCQRELFGIMRSVPLTFRKKNGKNVVSSIQVALGKHTYAEWTKIHNMLRKKYKVNKSANASEREMYRAKTLTRYANIYDNGRIVMQVSRSCAKYGSKYSNYKCLWYKDVMHLVYWDDIEARAFMKLIKKRTKKEDL